MNNKEKKLKLDKLLTNIKYSKFFDKEAINELQVKVKIMTDKKFEEALKIKEQIKELQELAKKMQNFKERGINTVTFYAEGFNLEFRSVEMEGLDEFFDLQYKNCIRAIKTKNEEFKNL